jgi:POT family proton-dependent oligopeptide transporter
MLIGLIVYLRSQRYLPPQQVRVTGRPRTPLDDRERRVIAVLIALTPLAALFWVAQTQVWNVYNVWVRDHVNLNIAGWTMPVPWLQSIDGLAPLASMPLALMFWRWQAGRGREPDEFGKLGRGCLLFGSTAWLAAGRRVPGGAKIPLLWAIATQCRTSDGSISHRPPSGFAWQRNLRQCVDDRHHNLAVSPAASSAAGWARLRASRPEVVLVAARGHPMPPRHVAAGLAPVPTRTAPADA